MEIYGGHRCRASLASLVSCHGTIIRATFDGLDSELVEPWIGANPSRHGRLAALAVTSQPDRHRAARIFRWHGWKARRLAPAGRLERSVTQKGRLLRFDRQDLDDYMNRRTSECG